MRSARAGSRFKDRLPRAVDTRFEIGIAYGAWLNEIDWVSKQRFERLLEAKIGLERERVGMPAIEFDQKVDVVLFEVETATRGRAKKIEPPHMKAAAQRPQFLTMQLDFVNHDGTRTLSRRRLGNDALGLAHAQLAGDKLGQ